MEEFFKNLRAIDWYGIAATAALAFGILKNIISGWASGRRQERNERFAREARETDITPVQWAPGERTRIQAMEENQQRALSGIAALRSDLAAAIAAVERVESYLHKEIQCLKDKLNRSALEPAAIAPIASRGSKTTITPASAAAPPGSASG